MPYALDEPHYRLLGPEAAARGAAQPRPAYRDWLANPIAAGGVHGGSDLLLAGVLFLFAAVIAVPLASRLGIGAVLGYLLAGIAIGPWGLGFISDVDEILHFSELGVVFLMFIIGTSSIPPSYGDCGAPSSALARRR